MQISSDNTIVNFKRDFEHARRVRVKAKNTDVMENRAAYHFLRTLDHFRLGVFQQYMTNRINSGAFADEDLTVNKIFEQVTKWKIEVNAAPP